MKRTTLWLSAFLALALTACGDDTSSKNNANGMTPDSGMSDVANNGGDSGGNNSETDAGNNGGDDLGNNNNNTPDGGDDDMAPPNDMGGGDDMDNADMGPDVGPNICGNRIVEGIEECDDGNNSSDDDCNPDCTFTCGDGAVGANEACDTAIPDGMDGACPTSCDDGDACTTGTLQGSECQAQCVFGDITACTDGDLCCPMMCNANNDDDCMAVCGNDVVEGTEICDGDCPADVTECDDGDACTADGLTGSAATCDAVCTNDAITACVNDDGCCPAMCDSTMDNDCSATCGNGTVEPPETCDADCPTSPADCDDGDVCTADAVSGSAANCTAMCENTPLGCSMTADGCCPTNCDSTTDADCTATCGNGTVEAGEQCDDGGTVDGDGCDANCQSEATAYRLSDLDLMDPHVHVDVLTCMDITNSVLLNLAPPINEMLEDAIQCDGACDDTDDDDGDLDLSFLLIFRPLDQGGTATGDLSIATADCSAPMSSTSCVVDSSVHTVQDTTFTNDATADCLDAIPNTARPYSPAIDASQPPCFASTSFDLTVDIQGIQIPLSDVQVGASYVGNPANSLATGLLRGFISETTADAIIIPESVDLVGGDPLSMLLPGGDPPDTNDACGGNDDCTAAGETCEGGQCQTEPNCAGHDDRDTHNGESGWWFYFNFPADEVPFTEL